MIIELFNNETSMGTWTISDTTECTFTTGEKQGVFKFTLGQYTSSLEIDEFISIFKCAKQCNKVSTSVGIVRNFVFDGVSIIITQNSVKVEFARRENA